MLDPSLTIEAVTPAFSLLIAVTKVSSVSLLDRVMVWVVEPSMVWMSSLVAGRWSRFRSAAVVESPSVTDIVPLPPPVSVRRMPSPVALRPAVMPRPRRLMALTTSPTVCMELSTVSVAVLPVESVNLTVPSATPPPPLRLESSVFIETTRRCMSPLLTDVTAPSTAMPNFVAVVVPSLSLATIMLPAAAGGVVQLDAVAGGVDLGGDAHSGGVRWLIDRVNDLLDRLRRGEVDRGRVAAAVGQVEIAEWSEAGSAVEAAEQDGLQAAEDAAARDRAGAVAARGARDRAAGDRVGEAKVVQRGGAVQRGQGERSRRSQAWLSVMMSRLLVESIEAESSPGAAALISSTISPRVVGGVPVVLPEAMGANSIVPLSPLANVYPMSGSTLLVDTPAPSFSALRFRLQERLRIWLPSAVDAATLMPARPREAAVVPPSTSWTLRFDASAVSPVLSIKSMRSPSATAVTLTVPLLLMSLSTSPMVCAVDRSMVAVAPLRSVILIFPGTKPLPPLSESRLTLVVEVRPEAEA